MIGDSAGFVVSGVSVLPVPGLTTSSASVSAPAAAAFRVTRILGPLTLTQYLSYSMTVE
jgi:hypothetical protein